MADTLEELWISYNLIEKLTNVDKLTKLRVLYVSNNKVENYKELEKLTELSGLEELLLVGNPLWEAAEKPEEIGCEYRIEVLKRVPQLVKLDGIPVDVDEREAAKRPRRRGQPRGRLRGVMMAELSSSPWRLHKRLTPAKPYIATTDTRARARPRSTLADSNAGSGRSLQRRRVEARRYRGRDVVNAGLNRGACRPSASTSLRRRRRGSARGRPPSARPSRHTPQPKIPLK